MEAKLADFIRDTPQGREAESILRACVHCGFCTATCPTYQLTGDELDGPRGRIYLIKQLLEGKAVTATTRRHLDRCLVCRSCESTCPSGVSYHRLLDIGRETLAARAPRPMGGRLTRAVIREALARPGLFGLLIGLGRRLRAALPERLAKKIPEYRPAGEWPPARHARRYLTLAGCVQAGLAPAINAAAARVLDRVGVSLVVVPEAGCCGALRLHTDDHAGGLDDLRRLIETWGPRLERGEVDGVVVSASGCAAHLRDAGKLLAHDPFYAERAEKLAARVRDLSEVVAAEAAALAPLFAPSPEGVAVAFHSPCTLQHGQGIRGVVESILTTAGYRLTAVADPHLCCGSAGTYSLLEPLLSGRLRKAKLQALSAGRPALIATANIGCMTQLTNSELPVRHWIELVDDRLA
jgi:glycolate oxidase iron-sulfur subunit